jgi:hypothetical protein
MFDVRADAARSAADAFAIDTVFATLADAASSNAIFDLAVPRRSDPRDPDAAAARRRRADPEAAGTGSRGSPRDPRMLS